MVGFFSLVPHCRYTQRIAPGVFKGSIIKGPPSHLPRVQVPSTEVVWFWWSQRFSLRHSASIERYGEGPLGRLAFGEWGRLADFWCLFRKQKHLQTWLFQEETQSIIYFGWFIRCLSVICGRQCFLFFVLIFPHHHNHHEDAVKILWNRKLKSSSFCSFRFLVYAMFITVYVYMMVLTTESPNTLGIEQGIPLDQNLP